eukprot:gene259-369_t
MSLGVGFAAVGAAEIFTSLGSAFGGTSFAPVPKWLTNLAAFNGKTFGLPIPPVVLIWFAVSALLIWLMKNSWFGRGVYALGGSRTAAARLRFSEIKTWTLVHGLSGAMSAVTGVLLLGFSGGGFVGVGDPYLFSTVAAVVIGGTSLLGGSGGYGATLLGALVRGGKVADAPWDPAGKMRTPGFKVLHKPSYDPRSSCPLLADCLAAITGWSQAHPSHLPIILMIEVKEDAPARDRNCVGLCADGWMRLKRQLRDAFGSALLLPGDVGTAWPTLGALRGKVMVMLLDEEDHARSYRAATDRDGDDVIFTAARPAKRAPLRVGAHDRIAILPDPRDPRRCRHRRSSPRRSAPTRSGFCERRDLRVDRLSERRSALSGLCRSLRPQCPGRP